MQAHNNCLLQQIRSYIKLYIQSTNQPQSQFPLFPSISTILENYHNAYPISNSTIITLITSICDLIYPEANQIPLCQKLTLIHQTCTNYHIQYQHSIKKRNKNQQVSKEYEKQITSKLLHLLLHYSGSRHIVHISLISVVFASLGILRKQALNFHMLAMILGSDNIKNHSQRAIIQECLKIIYDGQKKQAMHNPYMIVALFMYLGKSGQQNSHIILEIVNHPYEIVSALLKLKFEAQGNCQNQIIECHRKLQNLFPSIIDNHALKSITNIFQDPSFISAHDNILIILKKIIRYDLSVLIVKNFIKKMQITEINSLKINWSTIFELMQASLKFPAVNHPALRFQNKNSYLTVLIEQMCTVRLKYRSYQLSSERILFKICTNLEKSDKAQFDEIWFTIRYLEGQNYLVSTLYFKHKIVERIQKQEISLNIFYDNTIEIECLKKSVSVKMHAKDQKLCCIQINNFLPNKLVIGDNQGQLDRYITEISHLTIETAQHQHQQNILQLEQNQHYSKIIETQMVCLIVKQSMAYILKLLGDLQLIMIMLSHLIRKVQNKDVLADMISKVMNFLEEIALVKGVTGKDLSPEQKQKRICHVSCLIWVACRHKKHGRIIIELVRFLAIRKKLDQVDNLEILCNFALFKDMNYHDFKLILDKIDTDLNSLIKYPQNCDDIILYCERMILDLVMFYKHIQLFSTTQQEDTLYKHAHILRIVYRYIKLCPKRLNILGFILFVLKILYLLIDRRKQNDFIDTTMGMQIVDLAYKLSVLVFNQEMESLTKNIKENSQAILSKKQEILIWLKQILFCLQNQILYDEASHVKYLQWDKNKEEFGDLKSVRESQLIDICQKIQVYVISSDIFEFKKLFNLLNKSQYSFFWSINFLEVSPNNHKALADRFVFLCKHLINPKSFKISDKHALLKILVRTFQYSKYKMTKLPHLFFQQMLLDSEESFQFLQNYCREQAGHIDHEKTRIAFEQNMLYLLYALPMGLYSNSHSIRQWLKKEKKLNQTVEVIESHLIIKQLASNTELYVSKNQQVELYMQNLSKIQFFSEISAQNLSEIDGRSTHSQISPHQKEKKFALIKTDLVRKALQQIKLLANQSQISKFYQLTCDSEAQIKGLYQNFHINIDSLINMFDNSENLSFNSKISKLKSIIFFIKSHIYKFSCMIIDSYIFEQIPANDTKNRPTDRKKSISIERSKILHEQSQKLVDEFMSQRRKNFHKIERLWHSLQHNHKYFWEVFFDSDNKQQSLGPYCNQFKMRGLIKIDNEKREIELPKTVFNSSHFRSISISSDKDCLTDDLEDSIFSGSNLYDLESSYDSRQKSRSPQKLAYYSSPKKKAKKVNQFSVIWITTSKMYQGILSAQKQRIKFEQDEIPDQGMYEIVCANEQQKRNYYQIQKSRQTFEIIVNKNLSIIPKKYLNYETSLQIFSEHKSYFIRFRKGINRQKFLKLYATYKNVITSEAQIKQLAKSYMKKWQDGDISNFQYLMNINDLASRTFNDLSQYYVFPWTVTNFKDKISQSFIQNKHNYRDLSKPVGALNKERLEMLLEKYDESKKYTDIPQYLYGSFYSNPAIVCNYLVRLEPFSLHHYLLQRHNFDLADRIFYSVSDQFKGCMNNMGDYKELIPEFYFFPEFLRNRSKYNFGYRQNKEIVNNVELPKWTHNDSPSQQAFVFGMRKCLQSQVVTNQLNQWIDLIFGEYTQKEKAMDKKNLYIDTIYKEKLKESKTAKEKQVCFLMYKQFGQMPRQIFDKAHEKARQQNRYYGLKNCKTKKMELREQIPLDERYRMAISHRKLVWVNDKKYLNLDKINSQKLETIGSICVKVENAQKISNLQLFKCDDDDRELFFISYLKSGTLIVRQTVFNKLKRDEIKQQVKVQIPTASNCRLVKFYEYLNLIIIAEGSNIKLLKYWTSRYSEGLLSKKGNKFMFQLTPNEFTQHRSQIEFIEIYQYYGLLLSLDSSHKIYVLKLSRNQINVIQSFKLKKLSFCQSIKLMKVHEMGYILVLTSSHSIYVYNLMGDYISKVDLESFSECKRKTKESEEITTFEIWNHQSSQIVIGTNFGHIYIVDFIFMDEYEKKSISQYQIRKIVVNRIGRHWQCICADRKELKIIESQKYLDALKRQF